MVPYSYLPHFASGRISHLRRNGRTVADWIRATTYRVGLQFDDWRRINISLGRDDSVLVENPAAQACRLFLGTVLGREGSASVAFDEQVIVIGIWSEVELSTPNPDYSPL